MPERATGPRPCGVGGNHRNAAAGLGPIKRLRGPLDEVTKQFIVVKLRNPDRCPAFETNSARRTATRR